MGTALRLGEKKYSGRHDQCTTCPSLIDLVLKQAHTHTNTHTSLSLHLHFWWIITLATRDGAKKVLQPHHHYMLSSLSYFFLPPKVQDWLTSSTHDTITPVLGHRTPESATAAARSPCGTRGITLVHHCRSRGYSRHHLETHLETYPTSRLWEG